MKNGFYILIFLLAVVGFVLVVSAQEDDPFADIIYPIAELGNCESREACGVFCDEPDNAGVCLDFAEANDLIPLEEIEMARKMLALGETDGPGGCQGKAQCDAFCDDINNIKECIAFAEKYDLMPSEELAEAKKVAQALEQGLTPPNNCKGKEECDAFCSQPENMKECITFAKAAGLIPPEELEEAGKVLAAIEKGAVPPPCGRKDECEDYCSAPENFESCITFAEAAGFVSPEEAAMARKTGGRGPGDCRGKEECEAYCEDPANMEVCVDFALEYGFMSPEEAEQAKKMLAAGFTSGPGGCKGKEECEAFCDDIANMAECVDFAEKAGFMTPEDAARGRRMAERGINMMQGGPGGCQGEEECRAFCEDPANGETCLNFAVQIGEMSPEEAEQARRGAEAMMQGGPGGCRGEECRTYCDDASHNEECVSWALESGMIPPEEAERMNQMREQMMRPEGGGFGPPEEGFGEEGFGPGFGPEGMPGGIPPDFEGQMPPEGFEGEMPGGFTEPPSQEQMQQIQQQMQQQIQQQMQQTPPQPERVPLPAQEMPPQSFLGKVKNFLAGTGLLIGK